jgi:large subunit ribosomal protein L13
MKCYQAKAHELAKHWYVIDAENAVVGRLAAQIAPILMGKHRPTYTPYLDTGDYVIVTNVDKVVFTGEKWRQKFYQRYSGYPGGQKEEAAWKLFERHPERILHLAVQRMMPKNKIGRHMLLKLKLYVGPDHPHQAQCPIPLAPKSGRPTPAGAVYDTTIPADVKAILEKIVDAAQKSTEAKTQTAESTPEIESTPAPVESTPETTESSE